MVNCVLRDPVLLSCVLAFCFVGIAVECSNALVQSFAVA